MKSIVAMKKQSILLAISVLLLCSACIKEEVSPTTIKYEIPTTYTFERVNYASQTQRLLMLDELLNEVKKGNVPNTVVNAQKLREMYSNFNNRFADASLNSSGIQLKDKTYLTEQSVIESYFDSLETISTSTTTGSMGVAGVVSTKDRTRMYLLSANGIEFKERIDKGLMMALIYNQITSVYLSSEKMNVDNTIVNEATGTAMQHHWDEAFGYLAIPTDFPTNATGIKYLSKYIHARNAVLDCNKKIMNAFITGRAAINNNDYRTRDIQIEIICTEIEKVMAATAINYLNQAKTNFADDALRCHVLSEFHGFVYGLKFNAKKKITNEQITALLNTLGDNYYIITITQIDELKTSLANIYNLNSVKDIL
jgi:hypothetical protein